MKQVLLLTVVLFVGAAESVMVGGWTDREVKDEDVRRVAEFAAARASQESNSLTFEKLRNVLQVQSQVVAGTNYKITFEIVPTTCKKNSKNYDSMSECPFEDCANYRACTAVVWDKPWLNETKVMHLDCKDRPSSC